MKVMSLSMMTATMMMMMMMIMTIMTWDTNNSANAFMLWKEVSPPPPPQRIQRMEDISPRLWNTALSTSRRRQQQQQQQVSDNPASPSSPPTDGNIDAAAAAAADDDDTTEARTNGLAADAVSRATGSSSSSAAAVSPSPSPLPPLPLAPPVPPHRRQPLRLSLANTSNDATLGDIMTTGLTTDSSSSSSSSSSSLFSPSHLANKYGICHPLDRMALTANGNLQRLVSSYYDAPVDVRVEYCVLRQPPPPESSPLPPASASASAEPRQRQHDPPPSSPPQSSKQRRKQQQQELLPVAFKVNSNNSKGHGSKTWDRKVHLSVNLQNDDDTNDNGNDGDNHHHHQVFCTATSVITVYDPLCQNLVESGQVGLGQLFRFLDILPEFTLHDAAPTMTTAGGKDRRDNNNSSNNNSNGNKYNQDEATINAAAAAGGGAADTNTNGDGFWREYTLSCAELSCRIREDFYPNAWGLEPLQLPPISSQQQRTN